MPDPQNARWAKSLQDLAANSPAPDNRLDQVGSASADRLPPPSDDPAPPQDETLPVPPPPLESLGHFPSRPHASAHLQQALRGLFWRRTIIPLMLTSFVLLLLAAVAIFLVPPYSPFATLRDPHNRWIPISMLTLSAVMLALAILNMLHVRNHLKHARRAHAA